jgi:ribosome assembly protein YihI (activator of Der GTPase)
MIDQKYVDDIVDRCRAVVSKYGGQSDDLAEVRDAYALFEKRAESFAYVVLDEALKKVETNE